MAGKGLYERHFGNDPQGERALLSAIGFTGAFAACRGITHAIRAGVGPFQNVSAGGRHIHHSTFGIFGLLGIGFLWAQQVFTGHDDPPRWGSRITAATYGIAAALTLDEFALWLDLKDDYWNKQGRKSIDAVVVFGGAITIVAIASEALDEVGIMPGWLKKLGEFDIRAASQVTPGSDAPSAPPASSEHSGV